MNNPVRQHWVPQFYLRYFATPETQDRKYPQVWIFSKDKEDSEPKLTSIRKICASSNLYSPFNDDGNRDYGMEKRLGNIEHLLAQIWPALASGFVDFESDKAVKKGIALFLATMHLRNPSSKKKGERIHKQIVESHNQLPKDQEGRPEIDAIEINGEVHDVDTSDWFKYKDWEKNDHHHFFADSIKEQAIYLSEILLQKRWSVIVSESPVFITSDNPLSMHHSTKEVFGFGTQGTVINFPLSPTRLLVLDDMHNEPAGQYYPLIDENIGSINLLTWRGCNKFMVSHRDTYEILSEIVHWADEYEKNNV